jgi:hypothetical protein
MESVNFRVTSNDQNRITCIEIGGMLVLENAQMVKDELANVLNLLSSQVKITIAEPDELDISFIQLMVAFIHRLDQLKITYQFDWLIDEDQKTLLEHAGLDQELNLNK